MFCNLNQKKNPIKMGASWLICILSHHAMEKNHRVTISRKKLQHIIKWIRWVLCLFFFLILGCPIPGYGQEHSDCTVPCFEMCRNCMYYVDCMYLLVAVHNVSLLYSSTLLWVILIFYPKSVNAIAYVDKY